MPIVKHKLLSALEYLPSKEAKLLTEIGTATYANSEEVLRFSVWSIIPFSYRRFVCSTHTSYVY